MKDGLIQQVGTPKEVYDKPENVFVGGFIGSPAMNFFKGVVQGESIKIGSLKIQIPAAKLPLLEEQNYIGNEIILGIRPENISNDAEAFTLFPQAVVNVDVV